MVNIYNIALVTNKYCQYVFVHPHEEEPPAGVVKKRMIAEIQNEKKKEGKKEMMEKKENERKEGRKEEERKIERPPACGRVHTLYQNFCCPTEHRIDINWTCLFGKTKLLLVSHAPGSAAWNRRKKGPDTSLIQARGETDGSKSRFDVV